MFYLSPLLDQPRLNRHLELAFHHSSVGQQPLDVIDNPLRHWNFVASAHGLPLIFRAALTGPAGLLLQITATDATPLVLSELAGATYFQSGLLFIAGHFLTPQDELEQGYDELDRSHLPCPA